MAGNGLLCRRVINVTEDYFGPSASRFIERLSQSHLGKESSQLTPADMAELIKWARLAAAMLTDDATLVNEFAKRLDGLAKTPVS